MPLDIHNTPTTSISRNTDYDGAPSEKNHVCIKIPEGFGDVRKILGCDKALFTTGFITDPEDAESGAKLPTPEPIGDVYLNQLAAILAGEGATVATLALEMEHRAYLENLGLIGGNIFELPSPARLSYPEASVEAQLLQALASGDAKAALVLAGAVWMPAFPTAVVQRAARAAGGKTLMTAVDAVRFNSKHYLRSHAEAGGYRVPPGIEICHPAELKTNVAALLKKFPIKGRHDNALKLWIKFDSFSGGDGVFPFYPGRDSLSGLIRRLDRVAYQSGFYKAAHPKLKARLDAVIGIMPLVIEVDIASMPGTKQIISNYNVQGIVTDAGVTLVDGISMQRTENGTYIGNQRPLSDKVKQFGAMAETCFFKACLQAWQDGCRGYVGGDVIVRETMDGRFEALIFDFNARICASTFFVRTHHFFEQQSGANLWTLNTNIIFDKDVHFRDAAKILQELLFLGEKSDYRGVMPAALRSLPHLPNPVMKVAIFARDSQDGAAIRQALNRRGITVK